MPKTIEYKDKNNKHRIRHKSDNGNITYSTTQGYYNKSEMRDSTINTSIELLESYEGILSEDQLNRITAIITG